MSKEESLSQACQFFMEESKKSQLTGNELDIHLAKLFLSAQCPEFLKSDLSSDDDRLVKIGRRILAFFETSKGESVFIDSEDWRLKTDQSLTLIVEECQALLEISDKKLQIPKVCFGKTNIQMPVVTMGCMRFQQSWNRHPKQMVNDMNDVLPENQNNLKKTLRYALNVGINHIETARYYGSSEMQLGVALKEMMQDQEIKREDLIMQAKVPSLATIKAYRQLLETSFQTLQMDYFDLLSFHGVNTEAEWKRIIHHCDSGVEEPDIEKCTCLLDVAKEYQAAGKIKHIGFTSHGSSHLIRQIIESDQFAYANIHYHYFGGSYTTTGVGDYAGNLENIRLCHQKNMGMFIISPMDKGGRLYAPSRRLRDLTLPQMEPIDFAALWLFLHQDLDEQNAPCHTITIGAARPSDFDQPLVTAIKGLAPQNKQNSIKKVKIIEERLKAAMNQAVGNDFANSWYKGLSTGYLNTYGIELGSIVWYAMIIQAFGMVGYSKDRYEVLESNLKAWNFEKDNKENTSGWSWMPGSAVKPGSDYSPDLVNCPEQNRGKILESIKFAHQIISKTESTYGELPNEWLDAYDMRSWTAWCELPPPKDEETKAK